MVASNLSNASEFVRNAITNFRDAVVENVSILAAKALGGFKGLVGVTHDPAANVAASVAAPAFAAILKGSGFVKGG